MKKEHKLTDAAARARGMILGNPIVDQIKARGGVDPDTVVAAAKTALEREFATKLIPLQAIVFDARKPDSGANLQDQGCAKVGRR